VKKLKTKFLGLCAYSLAVELGVARTHRIFTGAWLSG